MDNEDNMDHIKQYMYDIDWIVYQQEYYEH